MEVHQEPGWPPCLRGCGRKQTSSLLPTVAGQVELSPTEPSSEMSRSPMLFVSRATLQAAKAVQGISSAPARSTSHIRPGTLTDGPVGLTGREAPLCGKNKTRSSCKHTKSEAMEPRTCRNPVTVRGAAKCQPVRWDATSGHLRGPYHMNAFLRVMARGGPASSSIPTSQTIILSQPISAASTHKQPLTSLMQQRHRPSQVVSSLLAVTVEE